MLKKYYRDTSYPYLLGPRYVEVDTSHRGPREIRRGCGHIVQNDMPVTMPLYFYQYQMDWSRLVLRNWWREQLRTGTHSHSGPHRDDPIPHYIRLSLSWVLHRCALTWEPAGIRWRVFHVLGHLEEEGVDHVKAGRLFQFRHMREEVHAPAQLTDPVSDVLRQESCGSHSFFLPPRKLFEMFV